MSFVLSTTATVQIKKLISEYLKLDPESRQTLKDYMRKVFVEESEDQD